VRRIERNHLLFTLWDYSEKLAQDVHSTGFLQVLARTVAWAPAVFRELKNLRNGPRQRNPTRKHISALDVYLFLEGPRTVTHHFEGALVKSLVGKEIEATPATGFFMAVSSSSGVTTVMLWLGDSFRMCCTNPLAPCAHTITDAK